MTMRNFLNRFRNETRASMVVETALVVPALVGMTLAGVEVSTIFVRQHELQAAANSAVEIVIAAEPESPEEETEMVASVRSYLTALTGLESKATIDGPNQISVKRVIRCGNATNFKNKDVGCTSGENKSVYVQMQMTEDYEPVWSTVGIGKELTFKVSRTIRIG